MDAFFKYVVMLNFVVCIVNAFPRGPPTWQCIAKNPYHQNASATIPLHSQRPSFSEPNWQKAANINIMLSNASYTIGQNMTITISSSDAFLGFVLVVNHKTGETQRPLGTFLNCTPSDSTQLYSYAASIPGTNNCAVHSNSAAKTMVQCVWLPPPINEGPLVVSTTIVRSKTEYWYNIQQDIGAPSGSASPTDSNLGTGVMTSIVDTSQCGASKGCILYPQFCMNTFDCQYIVTYTNGTGANNVLFEISAETGDYLSVGISKDEIMGSDVAVTCQIINDMPLITTAVPYDKNGSKSVSSIINTKITHRKASYIKTSHGNKQLICSFEIPSSFSLTIEDLPIKSLDVDLYAEDYRLLVADGKTFQGSLAIKKHNQQPLISPPFRASDKKVRYFQGTTLKVQIHSTLQILAWMLFSGLAVVIVRHYRPHLLADHCKAQAWFVIHILMIAITAGAAIASFIYILVANNGWNLPATVHGALGCLTIFCVLVNMIIGLARPDPDHPKRIAFDWIHFLVGVLTRVVAMTTFWLAMRIEEHRMYFDLGGTIIVAIWTGGEIIWFFYFLIKKKYKFWRYSKYYDCHKDTGINMSVKKDAFLEHAGAWSFFLYLFFVIGVTFSMLFVVWTF